MASIDYIPAGQRHQSLIEGLVAKHPSLKTGGFWQAMRSLADAEYFTDLLNTDREWRDAIRFVPDAWTVDAERREVYVFEAVVKGDITADKLKRMAEMGWALDSADYTLVMFRVDDFGVRAFVPHLAELVADDNWRRFSVDHFAEHMKRGQPA